MKKIILGLSFLIASCSILPETPSVELLPGTAWVNEGAGWAEEAKAVYAEATAYIEAEAANRAPGSWAVVLDLDETVMNNVQYQVERELMGESYTSESWYAWTRRREATLVPGVEDFLNAVNTAGGHVAFVTNRSDSEQLVTEENLAALGLTRHDDFRVLMTRARPHGVSAKDARYELVPPLLAAQGYPDVEVIAYLGDNVGDKPTTTGGWEFFCIDQGAMYGDPCATVPGPGR